MGSCEPGVSAKKFPSMRLVAILIVSGISMGPNFPGRHVEIFAPYSSIGIGEVVAYRNDFSHEVVAHRIVRGFPGKWVAKGDANAREDRGFVTPENYIAEVIEGKVQ
jgi:hypothetical protein